MKQLVTLHLESRKKRACVVTTPSTTPTPKCSLKPGQEEGRRRVGKDRKKDTRRGLEKLPEGDEGELQVGRERKCGELKGTRVGWGRDLKGQKLT